MSSRFAVNEGAPDGMTLIPRAVWERRAQLADGDGDVAMAVAGAISLAVHERGRAVSMDEVVESVARSAGATEAPLRTRQLIWRGVGRLRSAGMLEVTDQGGTERFFFAEGVL